eukprot:g13976.t1
MKPKWSRVGTGGGAGAGLGFAISKQKVEGERFVVCALDSALARDILSETYLSKLQPGAKRGTLLLALLRLAGTHKKKEKEKDRMGSPHKTSSKREQKTPSKSAVKGLSSSSSSASAQPAANSADMPDQAAAVADEERENEEEEEEGGWEEEEGEGGRADQQEQPQVTAEQCDAVLSAVKALHAEVSALGATQSKIIKRNAKSLYSGLLEDLSPSEEQVPLLQQRIQQLLPGWQELNTNAAQGTIQNVSTAMQHALTLLRPLLQPGGPLDPESQNGRGGAAAAATTKKLEKQHKDALQRAAKEKAKLLKRLEQLEREAGSGADRQRAELQSLQQHNKLLSEQLTALRQDAAEAKQALGELEALKRKAEESKMFEAAVGDMRKMLDHEVEAKQEALDALVDLSGMHKKHKLTWVPWNAVKACLICNEGFSMWGSKAQDYCRYCGRLFCKACCQKQKIPELGFNEEVRICNNCVTIRSQTS